MSRAFVRENDGDAPEGVPERPVSQHPNFVTARGLQQIDRRVRDLENEREAAKRAEDQAAVSSLERDLRYWLQRKSSAKLIERDSSPRKTRFGVRVTVRYEDGEERSYTLVGEDEAEPARGHISWISPIAQALIGSEPGDEVQLQGRQARVVRLD